MFISIVTTTRANPAAFEWQVRETLSGTDPQARVSVRAVYAPSGAQLRVIESDIDRPHLIENLNLLCDIVPDWLELEAA